MSDQLFTDGDVHQINGQELECVGAAYQENPETQERHSFVYHFRLKSEMDAEREAEAQRIKDLEAAQAEPTVDETAAPEPTTNPQAPEEETQHVR